MARGYIKCPVCGQTLGKAGVTSHLRSRHPETFEAFQNDKAAYYAANACNADGSAMQNTTHKGAGTTESAPVTTTPKIDTPTPPITPEPATGGEPAPPAKEPFREPKPKPKQKDPLSELWGF